MSFGLQPNFKSDIFTSPMNAADKHSNIKGGCYKKQEDNRYVLSFSPSFVVDENFHGVKY